MNRVIESLIDPTMGYITVVSAKDIKLAGGVEKAEEVLTNAVRDKLKTEKVKVKIQEVKLWSDSRRPSKKGYNARMVMC